MWDAAACTSRALEQQKQYPNMQVFVFAVLLSCAGMLFGGDCKLVFTCWLIAGAVVC
jgi:hypothetical protein